MSFGVPSILRWGAVTAAVLTLGPTARVAPAQEPGPVEPVEVPLTLRDAVAEALAGNSGHRIAGSRTSIARAEARIATGRLLPSLEAGAGFTRSVDPVFAFGTRLRQERFTEADFALDALNRPDAINDCTTDVGLRWVPLDASAWAGRAAAGSRAEAADREEAWSAERTEFRTKALYFAAAGAGAALTAAEAEEAAAEAAFELFRRREGRGLLTEADVLQAEAELRAAEAHRLAVARDAERAREDLALHLGWSVDRVPVPVDSLTAPAPPEPAAAAPSARSDVRALAAAREAAVSDARRAGLSFLPRLEAFAGWTSHAASAFEVDGSDWTVGLALRWTPFAGFEQIGDRQRAVQAREIARIRHEEALRVAHAEAEQARRDARASRAALEATRAARRAAAEARVLMRRRFEEGLATAAEFLQSEARAAGARGREVAALVDYNVALARLELVAPVAPGAAGSEGGADGIDEAERELR